MIKWLVTVLVVLVVFAVISQRFRAFRMPGDFSIPVRGRMYYIPIASTLVFSLVVWLISKVI
jgi:hypothetical protein